MITRLLLDCQAGNCFFDPLSAFLRESGRRFGNCSDFYAHHAAERLEICIWSEESPQA